MIMRIMKCVAGKDNWIFIITYERYALFAIRAKVNANNS